jgi:hypothetical protein
MEEEFILVFDIPRALNTLKVQVWRELRRSGCEMLQFSIWKSNDLKQLMNIALWIKKSGGRASILEEKFIF